MFYTKKSSNAEFQIHGEHALTFLESQQEALRALAYYGIGAVQLQEGRALFSEVLALAQQVQELRRQQMAATDHFHAEWRLVKQCYQVHLQAARRVLGRDAQRILTPMPGRYVEWMEHARNFYSAVLSNPAYQRALGAVNVTPDDLALVNQMLPTVVINKESQARLHSEMRLMLQQRDVLLNRSKRWFEVLMSTARVVLADQPGLLAPLYAGAVRSEAEKETTRKLIAERKAAKKKVDSGTVNQ